MTNSYLESKPRYEILDGLRGVAASIVVAFHLFETYSKGPVFQILNHGYLAVDFFFLLSGFVIGYAYDDRIGNKMSVWDFFKRRLIRLHPMVIFGGLFGLLLFYFGESDAFPLINQTSVFKVIIIFLLGCLMIPSKSSWDIRGWSETYPLNGPCWSLMLEYIANILYALVIRRFSKIVLAVFVALSALLTVDLALNLNLTGLFNSDYYAKFTVIGGWGIDAQQLYVGFSRLLYPFFCGLLISRIGRFIKIKGGFWICSLAITVLLCVPRIGSGDSAWLNGLYETICILILFPLIVNIGAGGFISGKRSAAICDFLGRISFPLYITHYPLVYMQMAWVNRHPDAPLSTHIFVSIAIYIVAVGVAYAALKIYDEPLRNRLKNFHFFTTKKENKS